MHFVVHSVKSPTQTFFLKNKRIGAIFWRGRKKLKVNIHTERRHLVYFVDYKYLPCVSTFYLDLPSFTVIYLFCFFKKRKIE